MPSEVSKWLALLSSRVRWLKIDLKLEPFQAILIFALYDSRSFFYQVACILNARMLHFLEGMFYTNLFFLYKIIWPNAQESSDEEIEFRSRRQLEKEIRRKRRKEREKTRFIEICFQRLFNS